MTDLLQAGRLKRDPGREGRIIHRACAELVADEPLDRVLPRASRYDLASVVDQSSAGEDTAAGVTDQERLCGGRAVGERASDLIFWLRWRLVAPVLGDRARQCAFVAVFAPVGLAGDRARPGHAPAEVVGTKEARAASSGDEVEDSRTLVG